MGAANGVITRVVIHCTAPELKGTAASARGKARSTAAYFHAPPEPTTGSAHYIYDVDGEEHCVPENRQAWHAPPNIGSIGIEICGEASYTREQWLSPQVWPAVISAAYRTVDLCERYHLPFNFIGNSEALRNGARGITSHAMVSVAFKQSTHTDPGTAFPWDMFMNLVTEFALEPDDMALSAADIDAIVKAVWDHPVNNLFDETQPPMPAHAALEWAMARASQAAANRA